MTGRERQVVEAVADGLSDKEIADRLHIAVRTVRRHLRSILEKLALQPRLEVAAHAHGGGAERADST
jgi:NarL family two-component system response regulator LiaR